FGDLFRHGLQRWRLRRATFPKGEGFCDRTPLKASPLGKLSSEARLKRSLPGVGDIDPGDYL
ncbi:MAG: hypothetical protein J5556_05915, partial [Deltaproteobacteria bacterium]|nr:hypothetical protein [Deltaproteobacteria bacterium]